MSCDVEKSSGLLLRPDGFASLASIIASDRDHSLVIYNRFDRLSARNLLCLQSELAELQRKQDAFDREDFLDDSAETTSRARNWEAFEGLVHQGDSKAQRRMQLVMQIREKVKEYKEAVMLDAQMLSLGNPSKQSHTAFRKAFMHVDSGDFPTLGGASAQLYDTREETVALSRPQKEDLLTAFIRKYCTLLFFERASDKHPGLYYFSNKRIKIFVGVINVLLAAAFLFGAICNLYYVEDDQIKLGLIAGYTTAFTLCIALVTDATRSAIFGACAAYAAVLVVFVSGGLGGNVGARSGQRDSGVA